jgi:hypothetical protein
MSSANEKASSLRAGVSAFADNRWRLKAIAGGSIGNLVEWYD